MSVKTATLDANSETFEMSVPFGAHGMCTMNISGTITVTWTVKAPGGSTAVPVLTSSGDAAAYTTSQTFFAQGPGEYIATASGVSGGTCDLEASTGKA